MFEVSHRGCGFLKVTGAIFAAALLLAPTAEAEQLPDPFHADNQHVGIISGLSGGAYAAMSEEMGQVTTGRRWDRFRVITTLGRGSVGNLSDLTNLRGIDFALLQSDVLEGYRDSPSTYAELNRRMRIVATFHSEAIHILARGAGLSSIAALAGKTINIGERTSGTNVTARNLFRLLGVQPKFDETPTSGAKSQLLGNGDMDGIVYVVAKGAQMFKDIEQDQASRLQLHFVQIPAADNRLAAYVPAQLTAADYSGIIREGQSVETRAVQAVLAVYAWNKGDPRYGPAARFIDLFFTNAFKLVQPNNNSNIALWCQVDLAGRVAGWKRFDVADEWINDPAHADSVTELKRAPGANCP